MQIIEGGTVQAGTRERGGVFLHRLRGRRMAAQLGPLGLQHDPLQTGLRVAGLGHAAQQLDCLLAPSGQLFLRTQLCFERFDAGAQCAGLLHQGRHLLQLLGQHGIGLLQRCRVPPHPQAGYCGDQAAQQRSHCQPAIEAQFAPAATDLDAPRPYPAMAAVLEAAGTLTPHELFVFLATPQEALGVDGGPARSGFEAIAAGDGERVADLVAFLATPDDIPGDPPDGR